MGEDVTHAGRLGEGRVLVDGVEVARGAGIAGELDLLHGRLDQRRHLRADLDILGIDLRVLHLFSPRLRTSFFSSNYSRTTVICRVTHTMSLSPSVMVVSRTTKAMGPDLPVFS